MESLEYFPYPSKQASEITAQILPVSLYHSLFVQHAYSDILLNYLRNDVSELLREVLWKMIPEMGMDNAPKATLPSKESMKIFAEKMKAVGVGAETKEYRGHRSNLVYANDLPTMIAEHLTFLPESTPNQIQEIYQAEKWLKELRPRLLTPSVQYGSSLFFVDEVSELEDGRFFITSRWILQNGDIFGRVYQVNLPSNIQGLVIDCRSVLDIPLKSMVRNGLSTREHIRRSYKIKGKRVVTVPVILYADDSSGNRSKKWNKHQSFYADLVGLPNKLQHQEFFINFLGTSTLQAHWNCLRSTWVCRDAWRTPRSVWDAQLGEEVVYRPLVLLFEGDNPMQSEFCSIGGLASLKFPRTCHVGAETKAEEEIEVNITKFMQAMLRTAADPPLPKSQISELQTSTVIDQLFDILEVSRINGETLVDYTHSLVGKDFRVIFQIATFALDQLIEQPYFQIWIALGRLGSIVWPPRVANKEIANSIFLVHLVDNVKRFGVPINYATEKFESYNGVMQLKSVHSNRHAPGKDIARSFSGFDRVVASIKVCNILEDPTFRRLLDLTLDIPTLQHNSQNGSTTPGSWVLAPQRKREIPAKETILHRICPDLPISSDGKNFNNFLHSRLRSFKTRSEEDATDQSFVLVNVTPAACTTLCSQDAYVFYIRELLLVESPSLDASLVKAFGRRVNFAGVHPSFSMPLLQPDGEDTELSWKMDSAGIPHPIVNVQHACGLAGCTNDGATDYISDPETVGQRMFRMWDSIYI
ncbi:hypothetical protein BT69DRAFT_1299539 [Atractiella rhizophila]|nr:hypothetical protein BT69DRAFT_1299539 [Atractiella rhizophila]